MGSIHLAGNFDGDDEDSSRLITAKVGEKAPDFALNDEKGNIWRLSNQIGKVTAILFYPRSETLVCTKQLCSVRDNWREYLESKAVVIGISPETVKEHQDFSSRYKLPLPLLADAGREVTKIFSKHWLFPIQYTRGIVVVDAKGMIRTVRIMLRAFRPSDRSVITAIHAARADALYENYETITNRSGIRID